MPHYTHSELYGVKASTIKKDSMTDKEINTAKSAVNKLIGEYTRIAKDPAASKKDMKKACDNAIVKMFEYIDLQNKIIEDLSVYRDFWKK